MDVDDIRLKCRAAEDFCKNHKVRILDDYHAGRIAAKYVVDIHRQLVSRPTDQLWQLFVEAVEILREVYQRLDTKK